MNKKFCIVGLFLVLSMCTTSVWASADRYIVKFQDSKSFKGSHQQVVELKQQELNKNLADLEDVVSSFKTLDTNKLWLINAVALTADENTLAKIKKMPQVQRVTKSVYKIYIDKDNDTKPATLREDGVEWNVERMKAPQVWKEYGLDGAGVVVGHLDTGVNAEHPSLVGKVIAFKDFTPEAKPEAFDGQGHGTHTAGTIAADDGIGVAPGARLIVARVFDTQGGTTTEILLSAMQWVVDPDGDPETEDGPALVSNSWGSNNSTDKSFWDVVQSWVDLGVLPVFSAGNNGMWGGKVGTPAAFPHSWAVAATTSSDSLSYFSSQGPVAWDGNTLMKPDIAGPGSNIVSCSHTGGVVSKSGTSMSCPGVAGVVALMYQADPSLTIKQVRLFAEQTAKDLGAEGKDGKFGSGLIDAYKVVGKVLENAELANSYQAYETAVKAEVVLAGGQPVSLLAAPLAKSIIERTAELDEGQFRALSIKVNSSCGKTAVKLLKEAASIRTARKIIK